MSGLTKRTYVKRLWNSCSNCSIISKATTRERYTLVCPCAATRNKWAGGDNRNAKAGSLTNAAVEVQLLSSGKTARQTTLKPSSNLCSSFVWKNVASPCGRVFPPFLLVDLMLKTPNRVTGANASRSSFAKKCRQYSCIKLLVKDLTCPAIKSAIDALVALAFPFPSFCLSSRNHSVGRNISSRQVHVAFLRCQKHCFTCLEVHGNLARQLCRHQSEARIPLAACFRSNFERSKLKVVIMGASISSISACPEADIKLLASPAGAPGTSCCAKQVKSRKNAETKITEAQIQRNSFNPWPMASTVHVLTDGSNFRPEMLGSHMSAVLPTATSGAMVVSTDLTRLFKIFKSLLAQVSALCTD